MPPVCASLGWYIDVASYMSIVMAIQWHETFSLIRTQRICPGFGLACSIGPILRSLSSAVEVLG